MPYGLTSSNLPTPNASTSSAPSAGQATQPSGITGQLSQGQLNTLMAQAQKNATDQAAKTPISPVSPLSTGVVGSNTFENNLLTPTTTGQAPTPTTVPVGSSAPAGSTVTQLANGMYQVTTPTGAVVNTAINPMSFGQPQIYNLGGQQMNLSQALDYSRTAGLTQADMASNPGLVSALNTTAATAPATQVTTQIDPAFLAQNTGYATPGGQTVYYPNGAVVQKGSNYYSSDPATNSNAVQLQLTDTGFVPMVMQKTTIDGKDYTLLQDSTGAYAWIPSYAANQNYAQFPAQFPVPSASPATYQTANPLSLLQQLLETTGNSAPIPTSTSSANPLSTQIFNSILLDSMLKANNVNPAEAYAMELGQGASQTLGTEGKTILDAISNFYTGVPWGTTYGQNATKYNTESLPSYLQNLNNQVALQNTVQGLQALPQTTTSRSIAQYGNPSVLGPSALGYGTEAGLATVAGVTAAPAAAQYLAVQPALASFIAKGIASGLTLSELSNLYSNIVNYSQLPSPQSIGGAGVVGAEAGAGAGIASAGIAPILSTVFNPTTTSALTNAGGWLNQYVPGVGGILGSTVAQTPQIATSASQFANLLAALTAAQSLQQGNIPNVQQLAQAYGTGGIFGGVGTALSPALGAWPSAGLSMPISQNIVNLLTGQGPVPMTQDVLLALEGLALQGVSSAYGAVAEQINPKPIITNAAGTPILTSGVSKFAPQPTGQMAEIGVTVPTEYSDLLDNIGAKQLTYMEGLPDSSTAAGTVINGKGFQVAFSPNLGAVYAIDPNTDDFIAASKGAFDMITSKVYGLQQPLVVSPTGLPTPMGATTTPGQEYNVGTKTIATYTYPSIAPTAPQLASWYNFNIGNAQGGLQAYSPSPTDPVTGTNIQKIVIESTGTSPMTATATEAGAAGGQADYVVKAYVNSWLRDALGLEPKEFIIGSGMLGSDTVSASFVTGGKDYFTGRVVSTDEYGNYQIEAPSTVQYYGQSPGTTPTGKVYSGALTFPNGVVAPWQFYEVSSLEEPTTAQAPEQAGKAPAIALGVQQNIGTTEAGVVPYSPRLNELATTLAEKAGIPSDQFTNLIQQPSATEPTQTVGPQPVNLQGTVTPSIAPQTTTYQQTQGAANLFTGEDGNLYMRNADGTATLMEPPTTAPPPAVVKPFLGVIEPQLAMEQYALNPPIEQTAMFPLLPLTTEAYKTAMKTATQQVAPELTASLTKPLTTEAYKTITQQLTDIATALKTATDLKTATALKSAYATLVQQIQPLKSVQKTVQKTVPVPPPPVIVPPPPPPIKKPIPPITLLPSTEAKIPIPMTTEQATSGYGIYKPSIENYLLGPQAGIPSSPSLLGLGTRGAVISPTEAQQLSAQNIQVNPSYVEPTTAPVPQQALAHLPNTGTLKRNLNYAYA